MENLEVQMLEIVSESEKALINIKILAEEVYQEFLDSLDAKPTTLKTYTTAIRQFYFWTYSNGIGGPNKKDILDYKKHLEETKKPSTGQLYLVAIKQFFKWSEEEGIYPNVAKNVKGIKVSKEHKKDALTANQVKKVISKIDKDTLDGLRDYALIVLMVTGGLRVIEAHRANIDDIRTRGGVLTLSLHGKGRNDKEEYIRLQEHTHEALNNYINARKELARERGRELVPDAPLFVSHSNNSRGDRLSKRTISGIAKEAMKQAGYESDHLTAHSLRHTAVTLALLGDQTIQEAQIFARHRSPETTLIYAHNIDRANLKAERVIEDAIFNS